MAINLIKMSLNPYWMNDFGIEQGIRRPNRRKGSRRNGIRVVRSPDDQKFRDTLRKYTTDEPWIAAEWML